MAGETTIAREGKVNPINAVGKSKEPPIGVEQLKKSKNFWINAAMNRYDREKDDSRWDFSDMRNLSEDDKTYLVAYLSNAYNVVNTALRSGEMNEEIKSIVK